MTDCYLYRHIRLDTNQPFYIGIGRGRRYKYKTGRNNLWNKIYKKCNGQIECEIVLSDLTPEEACLKETEFIKLYGRIDLQMGTLANLTDGGEGSYNLTLDARNKISRANTGKKHNDLVKQKMSDARSGQKHSAETKLKMSMAQIGVKNHRFGHKANAQELEQRRLLSKGSNNGNYKGQIVMLDKNSGTALRIFECPSHIRTFLKLEPKNNLSMIYACISGRRRSYKGFMWRR